LPANDPVDHYAAVKALRFRPDLRDQAVAAIEQRLDVEVDDRVLLEAAGTGSALGSAKASDRLRTLLWDSDRADLRMEAVLILTELRTPGAGELLNMVATERDLLATKSARLRCGDWGKQDCSSTLTLHDSSSTPTVRWHCMRST
jgi:hypothetical protein